MKISVNYTPEQLELIRMGCLDRYGLEVSPQDSVVFTHLDDNFNHIHEIVNDRKELLAKIKQHNEVDYSPWYYEKVINH